MNCPEPETLSDYALALLTAALQQEVAGHLATCNACCERVRAERALSRQVRDTVMALPLPPPARLQALMPNPPQPRLRSRFAVLRPLAALGVLLILFLGSLQLQQPASGPSYPTASTTALAATATQVPEAELTATAVQETSSLKLVPVPVAAVGPAIAPAPVPYTP